MKITDKSWQIIIGAVCLVYILLRLRDLTGSCLWFDEVFSVHAAEHPMPGLFWFVAQDLIHPPLFYLLLKGWMLAGGESLFWLRLFPVVLSAAALIPFILLCRTLKLSYPALALALGLLSVNGALTKYAQEVRMYSLLLCLALFSLWLFTRFFYLGKNFWLLTFINVLLIYTHYFGWLVVLSEAAAILILQRIKIRQMLVMTGICLVAFAPWIFALWKAASINADLSQNIGWMSRPGLFILFQFVLDVVEPFYYQASSIDPESVYLISIPLLVLIGAAKILYFFGGAKDEVKEDFYLLAIFSAVPIIVAFFASWISPVSVWGTRHLIIVFPPMLILAARFLTGIKYDAVRYASVALALLLVLSAFLIALRREPPRYIWCAWETFAEGLAPDGPRRIYVFEDLVAYHFWFALRRSDLFEVIKAANLEGLAEDKAYFLPRGFDGVRVTDEEGIEGDRFWIAFRDTSWSPEKPPLLNLIRKGYEIGELRIYRAQGFEAFFVEVRRRAK